MSKIIIHNETEGESDCRCMGLVVAVMQCGFMSGEKQYCWLTNFNVDGRSVNVISMKTRGDTHTFKVRSAKE